MIDIQSQFDPRNIDIDKVGVKDIVYPLKVYDKRKGFQYTIGRINMYVNLPRYFKGTHMSRFIEVLNEFREGNITPKMLDRIVEEIRNKLCAQSAHIEIEFPYFIEKEAPVTKAKSLMVYNCSFFASHEKERELYIGIEVPVTTLCPCSKEISEKGAHNQRGRVFVKLKYEKFFWIEDIVKIVEDSASCDIYSLLKRPDEKYVTERAYERAMFVEDVVRNVAQNLDKKEGITWVYIEAENYESIHNHSAYAYLANRRFKK